MKKSQPALTLHERIEMAVVDEIKNASDHVSSTESDKRMSRWDRYYGRPLGNENSGRSQFMSRDVLEAIEWILPDILATFVAEDSKIDIAIEGQPPMVGKALMQKIQDDLNEDDERSLYLLLYVWFKDAMVSDTAFVTPSWERDERTDTFRIQMLNNEQMQQLHSTPGITIIGYTDNFDGTYADVEFEKTEVVTDKLKVDNIPHWDVLVEQNAKFINDEYGKGYKSEVTLDYLYGVNERLGEEYFTNLDRLRLYIHNKRENEDDESGERASYYDYMDDRELRASIEDLGDKLPSLKTIVTVAQWYTSLDINGDGRLENIRCWVADNAVLLRYEENPDDAVMMSCLSPIIDCYKMFGIAYSEILIDIQNLKTMIMRRILDNYDFLTLGRTFVRPGAPIPIKELLQGIPGDVNVLNPDDIHIEYPQPFDSRALDLIGYVDQIKENRSGSTRANQGTDPEAINKNVGGLVAMQQVSQKRTNMVVRLFAETGLRDLYKKCVILYQNNLSQPFTVRIDGQDVTISPEQIQGKIRCKTNLGIELQLGMAEAERIQAIVSFLVGLNQQFPGIVTPEQIHKLAMDFVSNLGKKQPEDYVNQLKKFIESTMKAQEMAMQVQQTQQKIEQEKLRIDWAKVKVTAEKNKVDLTEIMHNFEGRMKTKEMDIAQQQRSDKLDFMLELIKLREGKNDRTNSNR